MDGDFCSLGRRTAILDVLASDRIRALQDLGYTTRESEFLVIAALHSGYFLRREYRDFAGIESGKTAVLLEKKLLEARHALVTTYSFGTQIYHLRSHPFYKAMGEGDNRHRRSRAPLAIKAKLMGLDFVLGHPGNHYLATEAEKRAFFVEQCGVDEETLPGMTYRAKGPGPDERRYFIEKYPLFIANESGSARAAVSFCYVDEGVLSTAGFESFLERYSSLFVALARFRLIYVAAESGHVRGARQKFSSFLDRLGNPAQKRLGRALTDYFQLRKLVESQRYDLLDTADLDRLGTYRKRFGHASIDRRYRGWSEQHGRKTANSKPSDATFESVLLPHNYDIFATVGAGNSQTRSSKAGGLGGETLSTTGFHRQGE